MNSNRGFIDVNDAIFRSALCSQGPCAEAREHLEVKRAPREWVWLGAFTSSSFPNPGGRVWWDVQRPWVGPVG